MYRLPLILCLAMAGRAACAQPVFILEGHTPSAWNGNKIYLVDEQHIPIDSTVIRKGRFHLSLAGQAPMPQLMQVRIDIGNAAGRSARSGQRDIFPAAGERLILDLAEQPANGDLLQRASLTGSSLAHELEEYNRYIRPEGVSPDPSMLPAQVKSFILIHPGYWISLLKFGDLVRTGVVGNAESKFANFPPELQRSELGRAIVAAIHEDGEKLGPGRMAPDFTAKTPDGKPLRLSDLRGKYVLLDFWASWCGPCRMENPNILENYHRFRQQNFVVLSFSLDENPKAWQQAIETDHLDWVHASDLKGWHSDVVRSYNVPSVPRSFLVDPTGKIIAVELRGDDLKKELEKLFNH